MKQLGVKSIIPANKFDDFKVSNEPVLGYAKGSKERRVLESALEQYSSETVDVPIVIGGKEYKTDQVRYQVMVSDCLNVLYKKKLYLIVDGKTNDCFFSPITTRRN